MGMTVGNTAARVCVGALVVTLHLIVLLFALNARFTHLESGAESRALTLVEVEAPERTEPATATLQTMPEPTMRMPRLIEAPPAPAFPPIESVAPTAPAIIRDWRGSLDAAATAAVARAIKDGGYHPLGPVEREQAGSTTAPSIFEMPRRKAGDIDHDPVSGRTLIWHNENCFTELRFPTIKDPNALVGAPNPPKCMRSIGERKARGDLFESIDEP